MSLIHITIDDSTPGAAPLVRVPVGVEHLHPSGDSDAALVARVLLVSASYVFAQGQPVRFGPEVPPDCLERRPTAP